MCTSPMRVTWGLPARLGDAEQGRGEVPYVQRGAVPVVKSLGREKAERERERKRQRQRQRQRQRVMVKSRKMVSVWAKYG